MHETVDDYGKTDYYDNVTKGCSPSPNSSESFDMLSQLMSHF